jgi:hypothetical protein
VGKEPSHKHPTPPKTLLYSRLSPPSLSSLVRNRNSNMHNALGAPSDPKRLYALHRLAVQLPVACEVYVHLA